MVEELIDHYEALKNLHSLDEKLKYVTNQIGMDFDPTGRMTVDTIFAAYLSVREQNRALIEAENDHWNDAVKGAREYFIATQGDYFVSYDDLSKMTLKEISAKL